MAALCFRVKGKTLNIDLLNPIGDGRFADVWLGTDEIGRRVAVKVLREEGKGVSTILDHARALVRSKHKNVVDVYSIESVCIPNLGDEKCIVMEHIDGVTLEKRLKDNLTNQEAYRIGHEISEGVKHIHAQGLVHMDLHAENVLVEADGNIKLIDIMYLSSLKDVPEMTQETRFNHDKKQLIDLLSQICSKSPFGNDAKIEFNSGISDKSDLEDITQSFENVFTLVRLNLEYMIDLFKVNGVNAKHYKFRSECAHDVNELRRIMGSEILSIQIQQQYFPDNSVDLITTSELEDVRNFMRQVVDGHVMLQTVQYYYDYTGERDYDLH